MNVCASYERLMKVSPILHWALEQQWSAEEASNKGTEYAPRENNSWLIVAGRAFLTQDGETLEAGPGQWVFPRPGLRVQRFEGPFRYFSASLEWRWPDGNYLFHDGLPRVVDAAQIPQLELAMREICEIRQRIMPDYHFYHLGRSMVTLAQFSELQIAAARWGSAYANAMTCLGVLPHLGIINDPRFLSSFDLINASPLDRPLNAEFIAASCGVSKRQIERIFKKSTGGTVTEFHETRRFDFACQGLLEGGLRIKEVASQLGFNDLAAFSRWFSRKAGVSPRDYRSRHLIV